MYSQTLPILFSTMSSSSSSRSSTSNDSMFLLRKDQLQDTANSQIAHRFLLKSESAASNTSEIHSTAQQEEEAKIRENDRAESKELQMFKLIAEEKEEVKEEEEEVHEDGFRTPTSLDHKIPEAKQCPAPPRKPKPSLKRKANYYSHHTSSFTSSSSSSCGNRNPPLDLSIEVELLLFQTQHNNHLSSYSHHKNPKKSRKHECPK